MNYTSTTKRSIAATTLALTCAVLFFASCDKKVQRDFPIDNYLSSDSVAKKDLIAHWSFDGVFNEQKSAVAPTEVKNTGFIAGVRGQALNLSNGYLIYPNIANINPTVLQQGFTVSAWVNVMNNGGVSGTQSEIFCLAATNDVVNNAGNINFVLETDFLSNDNILLVPYGLIESRVNTLFIDSFEYANAPDPFGVDTANHDYLNEVVNGAGRWTHLAFRYTATDASGVSAIDIFANGKIVSDPAERAQIFRKAPLGSLNFVSPANVLIGAFPDKSHGFGNVDTTAAGTGDFHGAIDELRLYKRALNDSEVRAIYDNEAAGR